MNFSIQTKNLYIRSCSLLTQDSGTCQLEKEQLEAERTSSISQGQECTCRAATSRMPRNFIAKHTAHPTGKTFDPFSFLFPHIPFYIHITMTMDDYSKIYIKPSKNTFKKERKKERKKEKNKMPKEVAKGSRGWRGSSARERGRQSQASKLELQLTTMPSLARGAPYHGGLLLVTLPWGTSSAPQCYPDGSGLEPWRNSP
jgi:hypothetical protein